MGFPNPLGDPNGEFIVHGFLWSRRRGLKHLGTLPGDSTSQALSINSRGQVMGLSTSKAGANRAFIWQDGVMTDLQRLMVAGFPDSLISAQDINDHGGITGRLCDRNGSACDIRGDADSSEAHSDRLDSRSGARHNRT